MKTRLSETSEKNKTKQQYEVKEKAGNSSIVLPQKNTFFISNKTSDYLAEFKICLHRKMFCKSYEINS